LRNCFTSAMEAGEARITYSLVSNDQDMFVLVVDL